MIPNHETFTSGFFVKHYLYFLLQIISGYVSNVRESLLNINTIQNNQIGRISDIKGS